MSRLFSAATAWPLAWTPTTLTTSARQPEAGGLQLLGTALPLAAACGTGAAVHPARAQGCPLPKLTGGAGLEGGGSCGAPAGFGHKGSHGDLGAVRGSGREAPTGVSHTQGAGGKGLAGGGPVGDGGGQHGALGCHGRHCCKDRMGGGDTGWVRACTGKVGFMPPRSKMPDYATHRHDGQAALPPPMLAGAGSAAHAPSQADLKAGVGTRRTSAPASRCMRLK